MRSCLSVCDANQSVCGHIILCYALGRFSSRSFLIMIECSTWWCDRRSNSDHTFCVVGCVSGSCFSMMSPHSSSSTKRLKSVIFRYNALPSGVFWFFYVWSFTILTCVTVNSASRLALMIDSPLLIAWYSINRFSIVRVPTSEPQPLEYTFPPIVPSR